MGTAWSLGKLTGKRGISRLNRLITFRYDIMRQFWGRNGVVLIVPDSIAGYSPLQACKISYQGHIHLQ
jgi:hypothetical protein